MNRKYLGVIGNKSLVRDADNRAIINVDDASLNKYKQERDFKLRLARMMNEHDSMRSDMLEIKSMLAELLGRHK